MSKLPSVKRYKIKWLFLFGLIATLVHPVSAQEFQGFVNKLDSVVTPAYLATVELKTAISKKIDTLQTNADGAYFFALQKSQKYSLRISYPGYADTSFTFITDKKGITAARNITVLLKHHGITLMGGVRGQDDNFPIRNAVVVLKNVMTREEHRVTTGIDGSYSFRLDYENNYRLSVDKYSQGIMNKYRDTSFYISTLGFNRPADFMLYIYLREDHVRNTEPMEDYDPTKGPANSNLKPSVDVVHKTYKASAAIEQIPVRPVVSSNKPAPVEAPKSAPAELNKLSQETKQAIPQVEGKMQEEETKPSGPRAEISKLASKPIPKAIPEPLKTLSQLKQELKSAQKELEALKKQQAQLEDISKSISEADKKKKGKGKELEVQVIRDAPRLPGTKLTVTDLATQRQDAENKIKEIEGEMATLKSEAGKK